MPELWRAGSTVNQLVNAVARGLSEHPVLSVERSIAADPIAAQLWVSEKVDGAWLAARASRVRREDSAAWAAHLCDSIERRTRGVGIERGCTTVETASPRCLHNTSDESPSVRLHDLLDDEDENAAKSPPGVSRCCFDDCLVELRNSITDYDWLCQYVVGMMLKHRALQVLTPSVSTVAVGYAVCVFHDAAWNLLFETPSPFEPWLALWRRGLWPWWEGSEAHVLVPQRVSEREVIFTRSGELPLALRAPTTSEVLIWAWQRPVAPSGMLACIANKLRLIEFAPEPPFTIGSDRTCWITGTTRSLAHRHAAIERLDGALELRVLRGASPCRVNGREATIRASIADGDQLIVGGTLLHVCSARAKSEP